MGIAKDADGEGPAIDAETSELLDGEVKKGKARKFILIFKGAQIKKLIVFKKGPYQTRIQQAKKDGFRGEVACGIVTGSGVSLSFQLAGNKEVADAMSVDQAVEGEPTKTSKLKEFLAENNLARKPEYQIIHDATAVARSEGEGDDSAAAESNVQAAAPKASAPPSDAIVEASCRKLKSALEPRLKEAEANNPGGKSEMDRLWKTATAYEKAGSFHEALNIFKTLGKMVVAVVEPRANSAAAEGADNAADEAESPRRRSGSADPRKAACEAKLHDAKEKVESLRKHSGSADVQKQIVKLDVFLEDAKTYVQAGKYVDANLVLSKLLTHYADAHKLQLGKDDYIGLLHNAQQRLKALEQHPGKDNIKSEIKSIHDLINDAQTEHQTEAHDNHDKNKNYATARKTLSKVENQYIAAKKKADQTTPHHKHVAATDIKLALDHNLKSPAPDPAIIKLLIKEPGGEKELSKIIKANGGKLSRNALEAAIEARFGVKLEQHLSEQGIKGGGTVDQTATDKSLSLQRIYEALLMVPENTAQGKTIRLYQEHTGPAHYHDKDKSDDKNARKIDLYCMRAKSDPDKVLGIETELPHLDPICKPKLLDKNGEKIKFSKWTTLHEVGHAVDDEINFMKHRLKQDAFAGWQDHESAISEAAEVVSAHFKYDLKYITQRMKGVDPPPPAAAKPDVKGLDQNVWDARKKDFDEWCNVVMNLKLSLWKKDALCTKHKIGLRVYQLAYKNHWVSYNLAARKQGVTGYQFRAPGEWFAELYAANAMGVLDSNHPAKQWLNTLKKKTPV